MTELEKETQRIMRQIRLDRIMQRKRLYEQAKRQRKAERLEKNA